MDDKVEAAPSYFDYPVKQEATRLGQVNWREKLKC
jgi:hypothetical protein